MLSQIEGVRLENPLWSAFSFDVILQYYDGPRLLLQRSAGGQLYLAWWSDSDESRERWIYLPLSERRLRAILSGEISSLEGLKTPEDGYLLVVDKEPESNSVIQTIMTQAEALPEDALPLPGARLNLPVPTELKGVPEDDGPLNN